MVSSASQASGGRGTFLPAHLAPQRLSGIVIKSIQNTNREGASHFFKALCFLSCLFNHFNNS